jgi:hypothetical protein
MRLIETLPTDIPQIDEWINADPFHKDDPKVYAEGFLTGLGALSFCVVDDEGPLFFVRLDVEGERLRLATQFAPLEVVSKSRLITGLLSTGIPAIIAFAKKGGYSGIVFESTSESLIFFMLKQGWALDKDDDYVLRFEQENIAC